MIGRGQRAFVDAAADVAAWHVQLRAGFTVTASALTAIPGAVAVLGLGVGPLRLGVPCRVVYIVDESRRRGFACGTLPGHPESGEARPNPAESRRSLTTSGSEAPAGIG